MQLVDGQRAQERVHPVRRAARAHRRGRQARLRRPGRRARPSAGRRGAGSAQAVGSTTWPAKTGVPVGSWTTAHANGRSAVSSTGVPMTALVADGDPVTAAASVPSSSTGDRGAVDRVAHVEAGCDPVEVGRRSAAQLTDGRSNVRALVAVSTGAARVDDRAAGPMGRPGRQRRAEAWSAPRPCVRPGVARRWRNALTARRTGSWTLLPPRTRDAAARDAGASALP